MIHEYLSSTTPKLSPKEQATRFLIHDAQPDVVEKYYEFTDTYGDFSTDDEFVGQYPELLSHSIHDDTITVVRHNLQSQMDRSAYLVASYAIKLGTQALHTVTDVHTANDTGGFERILQIDHTHDFHLSARGSYLVADGRPASLESVHLLKNFVQYHRNLIETQRQND